MADTGQGGAIGTDQENGLDQIATRLFDGQRRQIRVVERAFGHHPIHRQRQLMANLRDAQLGNVAGAAAFLCQPGMGIIDGALATLYGNIHQGASIFVLRGRAASWWPQVKSASHPNGNIRAFC